MILRIPMLFGVKQSPTLRETAASQEHALAESLHRFNWGTAPYK